MSSDTIMKQESKEEKEEEKKTIDSDPDPRLLCPCGKRGECCCAACKAIFYCTPEHLKEDWDTHKLACKPIKKIKANRKRGGPAWAFTSGGPNSDLQSKTELSKDSKRKGKTRQPERQARAPSLKIQLHYRASYMNRRVFDDSGEKYGAPPLMLRTGTRSLMPALEEAVPLLQPGEEAELVVLPDANLKGAEVDQVPILLGIHRIS